MLAIDRHVHACVTPTGYPTVPMRVDLRYVSDDPYAVGMICSTRDEEIHWTLSRDTLIQGVILGGAGIGDVFVTSQPDLTHINVIGDFEGQTNFKTTIHLPTKWLKQFLDATCQLIFLGAESSIVLGQIDEALEELLNAD